MVFEKNLEMVEAVVPTTIADEVLKAFEARPAAMDPQMVHKEENLEEIVAGFKNRHTLQKFVGKLENLFPKQISWR